MALGAISGTSGKGYVDTAGVSQTVKTDVNNMQDTGAVELNITETSAATPVVSSSQSKSEQENNQNKEKKDKSVSQNQVKSVISQANSKMRDHMTRCEFSLYDDTHLISIKVIDKETDKVIKEIPPKETLEMIEKLMDLAGLLVDEKR